MFASLRNKKKCKKLRKCGKILLFCFQRYKVLLKLQKKNSAILQFWKKKSNSEVLSVLIRVSIILFLLWLFAAFSVRWLLLVCCVQVCCWFNNPVVFLVNEKSLAAMSALSTHIKMKGIIVVIMRSIKVKYLTKKESVVANSVSLPMVTFVAFEFRLSLVLRAILDRFTE